MVKKFRRMLEEYEVAPEVIDKIIAGSEKLTSGRNKAALQEFYVRAMAAMDELLDDDTRREVRNACGCCKSGWREKAVRKIAHDFADKGLAEKLAALGEVKFLGNPQLQVDGTIRCGIGAEGGFPCPCPAFNGWKYEVAVSPTYCLCCAGHFLYHYQIALGVKLRTQAVLSSALASQGKEPCRFVYEVVGDSA
jgi:hypothetical protein